ncbi:hypothetical protein [Nitrosopumilus sp.]|nr:hypothetical protein [Nitrosopumilus sp.]
MKIKCEDCSHIQKIAYDKIIFESEDEETFVTYLSLEMSKEDNKQ